MDTSSLAPPSCYMLFAYDINYPQGGVHDLIGIFDTLEEAKSAFDGSREIMEIVQMILCPSQRNPSRNLYKIVATGWAKPNTRPIRIEWTDL